MRGRRNRYKLTISEPWNSYGVFYGWGEVNNNEICIELEEDIKFREGIIREVKVVTRHENRSLCDAIKKPVGVNITGKVAPSSCGQYKGQAMMIGTLEAAKPGNCHHDN